MCKSPVHTIRQSISLIQIQKDGYFIEYSKYWKNHLTKIFTCVHSQDLFKTYCQSIWRILKDLRGFIIVGQNFLKTYICKSLNIYNNINNSNFSATKEQYVGWLFENLWHISVSYINYTTEFGDFYVS